MKLGPLLVFALLTSNVLAGTLMLREGAVAEELVIAVPVPSPPALVANAGTALAGGGAEQVSPQPIEVFPNREAKFWAKKVAIDQPASPVPTREAIRYKVRFDQPSSPQTKERSRPKPGSVPQGLKVRKGGFNDDDDDLDPPIPEPSSVVLLALGSMLSLRRRRSRRFTD